MIKVGLTGGIGSGKSTAAQIFETLGIPVYYADKEAKRLMAESQELRLALQKSFGENIYKEGRLCRKSLAKLVFNDTKALQRLNDIVHPAVRKDFQEWAKCQSAAYVIEESAILFETSLYKDFDFIISVTSPLEERIQRLIKRDKASKTEIQARINAQTTDDIRREKSDFVLENNEENLLLPQVIALNKQIIHRI